MVAARAHRAERVPRTSGDEFIDREQARTGRTPRRREAVRVHGRIGVKLHITLRRRVLENEVIPLFYERDVDGLPRGWIQRMMNSINSLAWRFSAHRMVMDYVLQKYIPAAGGTSCDTV